MKRSILIEVYRSAHQMIENNFYLTHRTIRHTSPKMLATITRLRKYIEGPEQSPHQFRAGRTQKHKIPNHVGSGFTLLMQDTNLGALNSGGDEVSEGGGMMATGDDIGVN